MHQVRGISRFLGVVAMAGLSLSACALDGFDLGLEDGGSTSDPHFVAPNIEGAWLYEVFPEYLPQLTSLQLCEDQRLQQQVSTQIEVTQAGNVVEAQPQGGNAMLGGTLRGAFQPGGGTGIYEHEEYLDLGSESSLNLGCPGIHISTQLEAQDIRNPRHLTGRAQMRLAPDPSHCNDSLSACFIKGTFHFVRP